MTGWFVFAGAPVMMSFPHFYLAEPSLLEAVEGLKPDPEKHDGFLDIHEASVALAWAYLGALAVIWLHCTHCHLKNMI
jgi:hypothetical protein